MRPLASHSVHTGLVPARAGIGLRAAHYQDVLEQRPATGWFEVHSENYFGGGGKPLHYLEKIRADYPMSLHGVGLSLGSTDPLNFGHLAQLKKLVHRVEPGFVSEHLSWSSVDWRYFNDLLPLPYTVESLLHVSERIAQVQDYLDRQILVENISSYLQYEESTLPEAEFLAELARRSGCGILLDINNIYVSACNHGFDAEAYLANIPRERVQEMHLAGFTRKLFADGEILIDTHNRPVAPDVWRLYASAVRRFGRVPTLIEWDSDLPALEVLLEEANKADTILEDTHAFAA